MRCEWRTRLKANAAEEPSTEVGKKGAQKGVFRGLLKFTRVLNTRLPRTRKKTAIYVAWPKAKLVVCLLIVSKIKNEIPQKTKKEEVTFHGLKDFYCSLVKKVR